MFLQSFLLCRSLASFSLRSTTAAKLKWIAWRRDNSTLRDGVVGFGGHFVPGKVGPSHPGGVRRAGKGRTAVTNRKIAKVLALHKDMSGISCVKDFKMTALFGEPKTQKVKDADDKIEEMKAVNEAGFVKENCDILRHFWYALKNVLTNVVV